MIDLIQSEYLITDDQILDWTLARMALAVRTIQARHRRAFRQQAKLLEAAVRHLATFSAQSKEAFQAAKEIQLLSDLPSAPSPQPEPSSPVTKPQSNEQRTPSGLIIPEGVDLNTTPPPTVTKMTGHFAAAVEELPDDADRRVTPVKDERDLNQPGSTERLMRMLGGAGPSGLITG